MFVLSGNDRDALLKDLRSYVFITCASFEPRILTVPDLLRANAPAPEAAFVFFPHDSGSRWEAECTELQEKHLATNQPFQPTLRAAPQVFVLSGNDRDALLKDLRSYVFITCASFEPRISLTVPDLLRANAPAPH